MDKEKFEEELKLLGINIVYDFAPLLRKSIGLLKLILEEDLDNELRQGIKEKSLPQIETMSNEVFVVMMEKLRNLSDLLDPENQ